ncbi:right-handed parallel beta-helix repeat-containing protein [Foetidibacter luteolus]|uniref:right-handed parallel beta-helix repeat-containing protein n=1 Tax=Foetidibacter luteolus TaxID=2608880 RepID=UPI00129C02CC|nr:right-handed parallel beta-helix repeat-containing protein [Foetidibacter luteolus]
MMVKNIFKGFIILFFFTTVLKAFGQQETKTFKAQHITEMQQVKDTAAAVLLQHGKISGLFYYSADTLADNGTSFKATAVGNGTWKREYDITKGINVQWFGAVGDGITNDAPALQQAIITAARQKNTAIIPPGNYFIPSSVTLYIPGNSSLRGMHPQQSRLITDSAFVPAHPSLVKVTDNNVIIENLGFSGGRPYDASQKSTAAKGRHTLLNISFDSSVLKNIHIKNCAFSDSYGRGIAYKVENFSVEGCDFRRIGRYNTKFETVDGAITNFGRYGSANVTIRDNVFSFTGTHAISSSNTENLKILNNTFSNISGIACGNQACSNVQFAGNSINNTGDNGVDFQRSNRVVISDNFFINSGDKNAGHAGSAAAIFFGDDYGTEKANNVVISNNFIKGSFTFRKGSVPDIPEYQNCGIYLIDVQQAKVVNNNLQNIGVPFHISDTINSREDGNGIMIVTTAKGKSEDVLIDGNSFFNIKANAIYANGQSREIKISNNYVNLFGVHGIYMSAVATNLFSTIHHNTVLDGRNHFGNKVAADIYFEGKDAWVTQLNISGNQLRNTPRKSYATREDKVSTTHGIYFNARGFARFNNIVVKDNQVTGHLQDEIGFSEGVSEFFVVKGKNSPITGFGQNYTGTTDDNTGLIVPGLNQAEKPAIISETFSNKEPGYGNYSEGSIIRNTQPSNGIYAWLAVEGGFAAANRWSAKAKYHKGEVVYAGAYTYQCVKDGISGAVLIKKADGIITDGEAQWRLMGKRAVFKALKIQ